MKTYKAGEPLGDYGCVFVREVDRKVSKAGNVRRCAEFRCRCRKVFTAAIGNVTSGQVRSCGCLKVKAVLARCRTHGCSPASGGSKLYRFWQSMKDRCLNPRSVSYRHYGGRGIAMHAPWATDFKTFRRWFKRTFNRDEIPADRSMDRVDNGGPYAPGNLRLATLEEQANNKRNNHYLVFQGKRMTLAQVARSVGMKRGTLWRRLMIGQQNLEEATQ
jgi:hypothetical protein